MAAERLEVENARNLHVGRQVAMAIAQEIIDKKYKNMKVIHTSALLVVIAMVGVLVAGSAGADNVTNVVLVGMVPGGDTIISGGSTTVTYTLHQTSGGGDHPNCNVTVAQPATVTITASPGVVTPSSFLFTACNVPVSVTFSSATVGDHAIQISVSGGLGGSLYDISSTNWTLHVIAPTDTTKPVITGMSGPLPNGNGWNNSPVTVSFTCADEIGGSGIATNTVGGQTVTTEGAGQSVTNTGTCVDNAGNIADPVTVAGINIDKTAPVVTLTTPAQNDQFLQNSSVLANWSATDGLSGIDLATATLPSGSIISTSTPGAYVFTVTATDTAGNTTTVTHNYTVFTYTFGGISAPISISSKDFKQTSTIPVKFQVFNSVTGLPIQGPNAILMVNDVPAKASGGSNVANNFRYDTAAQQYIYNLSTKSLSVGQNTLKIYFSSNPPANQLSTIITIK